MHKHEQSRKKTWFFFLPVSKHGSGSVRLEAKVGSPHLLQNGTELS
jgi:hypothetical protein